MKRLHVDEVREPIIQLLRENGPMTIKQIADELTEIFRREGKIEEGETIRREALYVILSKLEKEGLLISMPAKEAPKLSDQWWLYKKDKAWMLVEDLEKYGVRV